MKASEIRNSDLKSGWDRDIWVWERKVFKTLNSEPVLNLFIIVKWNLLWTEISSSFYEV